MIGFDNGIYYVVQFENGKYYSNSLGFSPETDNLQYASKYTVDWHPMKDLCFMMYLEQKQMKYKLIKVRQYFEIIDDTNI